MSDMAVAARRLAGLAGAALGWPPDRFWAATPAELACVVEALAGTAPPLTPRHRDHRPIAGGVSR